MKTSLLALSVVTLGASCMPTYAATEQDKILTLEVKTTEPLFPEGRNVTPSIHVVDIDSIELRTDEQKMVIVGYKRAEGFVDERNQAEFDLSKITGLEFTYLQDGKLPSPSIYGRIEDDNKAVIGWCPIPGASGYEVQAYVGDDRPDSDTGIVGVKELVAAVTTGAEANTCVFEGLPYSYMLYYRVRALSPDGEAGNSEWSSRSNFKNIRWSNYFALLTNYRYLVPEVLKFGGKDYNSLTVKFNLDYDAANDFDKYAEHFEIKDGKYVADKIVVKGVDCDYDKTFELSDADKAAGEFTITGLEEFKNYTVDIINSNVKHAVDAPYNTLRIRTKGHPLAPETLAPGDITSVLSSYMTDDNIPEGQVYYVAGDGVYNISSTVEMSKGFKLATSPESVVAGKRAKVFIKTNFNLGEHRSMNITKTLISSISFEGIDFDVESTMNYDDGGTPTGNYFINQYSDGTEIELDSLVIKNCSFQHFIRGFFRNQGSSPTVIKNFIVENCDFYNCGRYDTNGNGYGWVAGAGNNAESNIFNNMVWRNNTIYNSPRRSLFNDNNKLLAWGDDIKWNITFENNTIVNFSTITGGCVFDLRYMPVGSKLTVKNNLFIQTKDEADVDRVMKLKLMDIRTAGVTLDIRDNYCNGTKDDGIVTTGAFSATKNSAGAYPEGFVEGMTADDLVVKAAGLEATELMAAPNPPSMFGTPDAFRVANLNGLYYNDTEAVRNSEVFIKRIGASKWREGIGTK